jgi:CRP-like cAMP-binding protein
MSIDDDIVFLEGVPTLALLGREPLRIIAIGAESRHVHDGDILFREGEIADAAYVVQEGSFELASQRSRIHADPVMVGPGALIGEIALLTETVRLATATAVEPSAVMRIPRKLFLKMLEGYPDAARRLREVIASRASRAMNDIANMRPIFGAPQDKRDR